MNKTEATLMKKCGVAKAYYDDLVNARIRARYSLSEELSILRRREEAPEAFRAFYAFAEACKAEVAEELGGTV